MTASPEPLNTYRVEFTATYQFTTPDDGNKTTVTIVSPSENLMHGTSKDEVLRHMEKDHEVDKPINAKRVLKFVRDGMWNLESKDVTVTYHPDPIIDLASPEQIKEIIEDYMESI